jgi:ABC-type dipeptide/oligopeptide/nickel transport system permease subunit
MARAIGLGDGRIVRRHVVPNLLGDLVVVASLWTLLGRSDFRRENLALL